MRASQYKCRIGIAVAHRFMQRRNQVVVFFAGLVIEQNAFLQGIMDDVVGDFSADFLAAQRPRQRGRNFQHVVGAAGVAAGVAAILASTSSEACSFIAPKPAFFIRQRPLQQQHDLLFGERLKHIHAAARQQARR